MPSGYRYVLLSAFVWLALCGAKPLTEQPKSGPGKQESAPSPTATETPRWAYPKPNSDFCDEAQPHDTADLCAQWRAMVAAEKSANAAEDAVIWTVVATVLSAVGLGFLVWSLRQTEGALGEARIGNRIAMKANARATLQAIAAARDTARTIEIAERNADAAFALSRNNRAWVCPVGTDYLLPTAKNTSTGENEEIITFRPKYANFGQTPAIIRKSGIGYKLLGPSVFIDPVSIIIDYINNPLVVGPGQPFWTDEIKLGPFDRNALLANALKVMIVSRVEYNDIYAPDAPPNVTEHCTIGFYKGVQNVDGKMRFIFEFHAYGEMNTIT